MKPCFFCLMLIFGTSGDMPFTLLQSQHEQFIAGRQESGGGVNFELKLVAEKSSKKLAFSKINTANKISEIKLFDTRGEQIQRFSKGDTLLLKSSVRLTADELQNTDAQYLNGIIYLVFSFKNKPDSILIETSSKGVVDYY